MRLDQSHARTNRPVRVQTSTPSPLRSARMKARIEGSQTYNTEERHRSMNISTGFARSSFAYNAAAISPMRGTNSKLEASLRSGPRFFKNADTPSQRLKQQSVKLMIQDFKKKQVTGRSLKDTPKCSFTHTLAAINEEKLSKAIIRLKISNSSSDQLQIPLAIKLTKSSPKANRQSPCIKSSPVSFTLLAKSPQERGKNEEKSQILKQNPLFVAISKKITSKQPGFEFDQYLNNIVKPSKPTEDKQKALKSTLESKLNIYDISEAVIQQNLSRVSIVLDYCKDCIQRAFRAFESNNKESMLRSMHKCYEYLIFCRKPQIVIMEMHQWILEVHFQFKEYRRCIEYSDRFLLAAHDFRGAKYSLRIFELMGHCYRETSNHKASLVNFYRMLFAALYLKMNSKELSAYASISREYYELGDVTTASYFYEKFSGNNIESDDSRLRQEFNLMDTFYCKEVIEPRERKHKIGAESPRLSYYEGFPLANNEKLYAMKEAKKRELNKPFEQIRQNAENKKGFAFTSTELGNPLIQRKYNKHVAMESVKLGDIIYYDNTSKKPELAVLLSEDQRVHFLTMAKINFTNNTDQAYYSHNSANRSPHYFDKVPVREIRNKKGIQPLMCTKRETSLRDDMAIITVLDLFNKVGLVVEKAIETVDSYKREFC